MRNRHSLPGRRGITVLALLLLIIAIVLVAIFLLRYLRAGTAAAVLPVLLVPRTLGMSRLIS
jgi:hypothetical protein